jgi:predicted RND superfamily exporter protein
MLDVVTPTTKRHFIGAKGNALITATTREMSSSQSAVIVDKVEAAIAASGVDGVKVTGVTVINARESSRTIGMLNASLLLSVVANLAVIALAFGGRSFGIVSFLPNMLPILAVGTMLFLAGRGMQFTAVIALTVAFGVAVNDSVHYINRFLHTDNDGSLAARLIETSRRIGPVIIGTTLIIIAGVSTTLTSGMPTIGLFGTIAALTLVAGIVGDLIVLPALMAGPAHRWFDRHRTIKPHEAPP